MELRLVNKSSSPKFDCLRVRRASIMTKDRIQFFASLQRKLIARSIWGWTALVGKIQQLVIPAEYSFPEPYRWCSGNLRHCEFGSGKFLFV